MTEEMKIEELLNSYIDGELSVRQRTEVKRMISNDPQVAVRLRQLQQSKTLVSALPVAQAPSNIMENIKARLEKKNITQEKAPVQLSEYREVKTSRRVLAAAAMISIAAVLVFVFNNIMTTVNNPNPPQVADFRLSGRLELKTNDLPGVQGFLSNAIENSGFKEDSTPIREPGRRIYTLNCSREGLNKILSELEGKWDEISSAKLSVNTDVFGESIQVASVVPAQIAEIVNQADPEESINVARDISIINNVNELLNKKGIPGSNSNVGSRYLRIQQPIIVSRNYQNIQQDNGEKTIQLRIILSR